MTENTPWNPDVHAACAASPFAYMIGWASGELVCHCKNAEEKVEELSEQLDQVHSANNECDRQFKELRSVLNDAHKHIVAVSKALKIPAR